MQQQGDKVGISTTVEQVTSLGTVSFNLARWERPVDKVVKTSVHHLQLSFDSHVYERRGCFSEAWGHYRFVPIGALFLFPADQILHVRSSCKEQQALVYRFTTEALERWCEANIDWTDLQLENSLDIGDHEIRHLMFYMSRELRYPGFAGDAMMELLAGQITIRLARYLRGFDAEKHSGGLAPWRLRLIDDYLAEHPGKTSLIEIAASCGLSVRQLSRAFRVSRGCSIGTYIAESRIAHARLLFASGMPVKLVAAELGFSSPSNFSAAFRRATGESPRTYLLRVRGH